MSTLADRRKARLQGEVTLRPVYPSFALELSYQHKLLQLINQMGRSVNHWLKSVYRKAEPKIVADELPASMLRRAMERLSKQWNETFEKAGERIADFFAQRVAQRVVSSLKRSLPTPGPGKIPTVKFELKANIRDVVEATVQANVALIKSIPAQYLEQVEGIVMRGVQNGRDLASVAKELEARLGVQKKRAALIARDQNNKATSAINRANWLDLGLEEAIWVHSTAGKEPRHSHVVAGRNKTRYKVSEGWYDPHEKRHIQPGELINCRCVGRPIVKGFS